MFGAKSARAVRRGGRVAPQGDAVTAEAWLTELSTTDLKDLFALRKEAVAK